MFTPKRECKLRFDVPSLNTLSPVISFLDYYGSFIIVGLMRSSRKFIKLILISKIDHNSLAIDSLQNTLIDYSFNTTVALLNPTSVLIANAYGRQQKKEIGKILQQTWLFTGCLSVPISCSLWFSKPILNFLKQPTGIIDTVSECSYPIAFAIAPLLWVETDIIFLKSVSKTRSIIVFYSISLASNVILSYCFIHGKLGIPTSGMIGYNYGILCHSWLMWAGLKFYFLYSDFRKYHLFKFQSPDYGFLKRFIKKGAPLSFQSLMQEMFKFLLDIMIGRLGKWHVTVNRVVDNYISFVLPISKGIRQGTQIKISRLIGEAKHPYMIRKSAMTGFLSEATINLLPVVALTLFPDKLCNFMVSDGLRTGLEEEIRILFLTRALAKFLEMVDDSLSENLKALLDTFYPVIIQLLITCSFSIPLSYLLGFTFGYESTGINVGVCLGTGVAIPFLLKRWQFLTNELKNNLNREKNTMEQNVSLPLLAQEASTSPPILTAYNKSVRDSLNKTLDIDNADTLLAKNERERC